MNGETASDALRADAAAIEDFLGRYFDGRTIQLLAIDADTEKLKGLAFPDVAVATAWAVERNAQGCNIYFSASELRTVPEFGKSKKKDVGAVHWLWLDADPRDDESPDQARQRILGLLGDGRPASLPEPSIVIASGNGVQALWRLKEPVTLPAADTPEWAAAEASVEDRNRWIANIFGEGGTCCNLDRVLRVPHTVNWPNEKKRKKGRTPIMADLLSWRDDRAHDLVGFEMLARGKGSGNKPKKDHASRSESLWADLCARIRAGETNEVLRAWLLDRNGPHAAHIYDQKTNAATYVDRQIENARAAIAEDWIRDGKGRLDHMNPQNVRKALRELGIELTYNAFADRMIIKGPPRYGGIVTDASIVAMRMDVIERFGFRPAKDFWWDAVCDTARRSSFHPVRDYLASLTWDGTPRLDRWLIEYGGAEDSAFNRAVSAVVLIAAVRRVRDPGTKFDEVLTLEGPQGSGKSTVVKIIARQLDWFTDALELTAKPQEIMEQTAGKWIVEIAELAGMRKSEIEHVKALLSRQSDRARRAYGRVAEEVARQWIAIGTTNSLKYLRDPTGNRRFLPVKCQRFNLDGLKDAMPQLFAEAAHREAAGESIELSRALWDIAAALQADRVIEDAWENSIAMLLGDLEGKIASETIWSGILKIDTDRRNQGHFDRIGAVMSKLGWEYTRLRFASGQSYGYRRGPATGAKEIFVFREQDDQGRDKRDGKVYADFTERM